MASDPPKRRTGGSKKFQDASDELRVHMSLRAKVTRLSEMADRQDQVTGSIRELISSLLVDLDKQGEKFMTRVEDSATPSEPPPSVHPIAPAPDTRPSMKPTVMALPAVTPRSFEHAIREDYKKATNEAQRTMVLDRLRYALEHTPGFAADEKLQGLSENLRKQR